MSNQGAWSNRGRVRGQQQPQAPLTRGEKPFLLEEDFPKLGASTPTKSAWGKPAPAREPQQEVKKKVVAEIPPMPEPIQESILISKDEEEEAKPSQIINQEFPAKPAARGTEGQSIKLRTNHYGLNLKDSFTVYQYDVKVNRKSDPTKEILSKRLMRKVFAVLQSQLPSEYENKMVCNFSKNLYSLIRLPFETSESYKLKIEKSFFLITLTLINQVTVKKNFYQPLDIQILNLIVTHNFNYSCINVNRSFFKEGNDTFNLGFGLDLWKGAYSSVRPSELGLTWNVDSANAAFLLSENLITLAKNHYGFDQNSDIDKLRDAILSDKKEGVIGYRFVEAYKNREIKTKTGDFWKKFVGFGPDPVSHKFEWMQPDGTKKTVSVADYLSERYGIKLTYGNLPCVDLGRENYLPMELCRTELKNKRKLDCNETKAMISKTSVPAQNRMNYINKWIENSNINEDPVLKEYKIDVDLRMVEVDGRVLEPPDVQYETQTIASKTIGKKGQWNHENLKFYQSIKIEKWIVLNFAFKVKNNALDSFINKLIEIGEKHGIFMDKPLKIINQTEKMDDIKTRRIIKQKLDEQKDIQLIVVIFGDTANIYKMVKTQAELISGIVTQGVKDKNVNKTNDQTISNILLKINCKVGGKNFVLSRENRHFGKYIQKLYDGPLMIFGADVTHPAPAPGQHSESIAAVVGSLDKECCYYAARLYAQISKKGRSYEMIHNMDEMFFDLLNAFAKQNGNRYPKRIVFYRDGVSEGQFSLVLRHEMNKMREACIKINPNYKPGITFVVVQKRHNTRFFPIKPQDQTGNSGNVPPGTVVDKHIVTKNMFDFFLCSHSGIQGTSRPCRYFLLHDDNQFSMNQLQILSHYLCHVYARCPRSVSYPAPAYYSHLAAFRGRDYIRPTLKAPQVGIVSEKIEINQNIKDRMFFV
ncbi:Eukaryotic translation initiation factor 2C 2 [Brachionus plicatilis]|uniref:Eukaryotic translation initiation factor 2C 2 n=1 Tax=Brachionus plicatilis TaxID=10195 RepID=A0A3M7PGN9_BRAPC|nr:Eukaryotic translation initiation factor 2C 2 [Brachionus plicatilis]